MDYARYSGASRVPPREDKRRRSYSRERDSYSRDRTRPVRGHRRDSSGSRSPSYTYRDSYDRKEDGYDRHRRPSWERGGRSSDYSRKAQMSPERKTDNRGAGGGEEVSFDFAGSLFQDLLKATGAVPQLSGPADAGRSRGGRKRSRSSRSRSGSDKWRSPRAGRRRGSPQGGSQDGGRQKRSRTGDSPGGRRDRRRSYSRSSSSSRSSSCSRGYRRTRRGRNNSSSSNSSRYGDSLHARGLRQLNEEYNRRRERGSESSSRRMREKRSPSLGYSVVSSTEGIESSRQLSEEQFREEMYSRLRSELASNKNPEQREERIAQHIREMAKLSPTLFREFMANNAENLSAMTLVPPPLPQPLSTQQGGGVDSRRELAPFTRQQPVQKTPDTALSSAGAKPSPEPKTELEKVMEKLNQYKSKLKQFGVSTDSPLTISDAPDEEQALYGKGNATSAAEQEERGLFPAAFASFEEKDKQYEAWRASVFQPGAGGKQRTSRWGAGLPSTSEGVQGIRVHVGKLPEEQFRGPVFHRQLVPIKGEEEEEQDAQSASRIRPSNLMGVGRNSAPKLGSQSRSRQSRESVTSSANKRKHSPTSPQESKKSSKSLQSAVERTVSAKSSAAATSKPGSGKKDRDKPAHHLKQTSSHAKVDKPSSRNEKKTEPSSRSDKKTESSSKSDKKSEPSDKRTESDKLVKQFLEKHRKITAVQKELDAFKKIENDWLYALGSDGKKDPLIVENVESQDDLKDRISRLRLGQEVPVFPGSFHSRRKTAGKADENPVPVKFQTDMGLNEFNERYKDLIDNGNISEKEVTVAGKIQGVRPGGNDLCFYDLWEDGVKVQIMSMDRYYQTEADYRETEERLQKGGLVGVRGRPGRTHSGRLSLVPTEVIELFSAPSPDSTHRDYFVKDPGARKWKGREDRTVGHCCVQCQTGWSTLPEFLNHLSTQDHCLKTKSSGNDALHPWQKEDLKKYHKEAALTTVKGEEFVVAVGSFYCFLCSELCSDSKVVSAHLSSQDHNHKYQAFLAQNPRYESRYRQERVRLLTNATAPLPTVYGKVETRDTAGDGVETENPGTDRAEDTSAKDREGGLQQEDKSPKEEEKQSKDEDTRSAVDGTPAERDRRSRDGSRKSRERERKSKSKDRDRRSKSRERRSKSRERSRRSKSRDRSQRSKSRDRNQRSTSRGRSRRSKSRERSRSKSRDRSRRSKSRDRSRRSKSRDRSRRSTSRDKRRRSRERDRKSKSRDRDRRSKSRERSRKSRERDRWSKDGDRKSKDGERRPTEAKDEKPAPREGKKQEDSKQPDRMEGKAGTEEVSKQGDITEKKTSKKKKKTKQSGEDEGFVSWRVEIERQMALMFQNTREEEKSKADSLKTEVKEASSEEQVIEISENIIGEADETEATENMYEQEADETEATENMYEQEADETEVAEMYEQEADETEVAEMYEQEADETEVPEMYEQEADESEVTELYEQEADETEITEMYEQEADESEVTEIYEQEADESEVAEIYEQEADESEVAEIYEQEADESEVTEMYEQEAEESEATEMYEKESDDTEVTAEQKQSLSLTSHSESDQATEPEPAMPEEEEKRGEEEKPDLCGLNKPPSTSETTISACAAVSDATLMPPPDVPPVPTVVSDVNLMPPPMSVPLSGSAPPAPLSSAGIPPPASDSEAAIPNPPLSHPVTMQSLPPTSAQQESLQSVSADPGADPVSAGGMAVEAVCVDPDEQPASAKYGDRDNSSPEYPASPEYDASPASPEYAASPDYNASPGEWADPDSGGAAGPVSEAVDGGSEAPAQDAASAIAGLPEDSAKCSQDVAESGTTPPTENTKATFSPMSDVAVASPEPHESPMEADSAEEKKGENAEEEGQEEPANATFKGGSRYSSSVDDADDRIVLMLEPTQSSEEVQSVEGEPGNSEGSPTTEPQESLSGPSLPGMEASQKEPGETAPVAVPEPGGEDRTVPVEEERLPSPASFTQAQPPAAADSPQASDSHMRSPSESAGVSLDNPAVAESGDEPEKVLAQIDLVLAGDSAMTAQETCLDPHSQTSFMAASESVPSTVTSSPPHLPQVSTFSPDSSVISSPTPSSPLKKCSPTARRGRGKRKGQSEPVTASPAEDWQATEEESIIITQQAAPAGKASTRRQTRSRTGQPPPCEVSVTEGSPELHVELHPLQLGDDSCDPMDVDSQDAEVESVASEASADTESVSCSETKDSASEEASGRRPTRRSKRTTATPGESPTARATRGRRGRGRGRASTRRSAQLRSEGGDGSQLQLDDSSLAASLQGEEEEEETAVDV